MANFKLQDFKITLILLILPKVHVFVFTRRFTDQVMLWSLVFDSIEFEIRQVRKRFDLSFTISPH